jgi:hypothetical protein
VEKRPPPGPGPRPLPRQACPEDAPCSSCLLLLLLRAAAEEEERRLGGCPFRLPLERPEFDQWMSLSVEQIDTDPPRPSSGLDWIGLDGWISPLPLVRLCTARSNQQGKGKGMPSRCVHCEKKAATLTLT